MINVVHMTLVYWTILCFSHVRNRTNLFNHHNRPPLVCTSKISHPHSVTSFEKLQGRQCKSWLCFCLVCFWHTFDFKLGHNTPSIVRKEWPIINSHGAMFAVPRGVVQYVKENSTTVEERNTIIVTPTHGLLERLHHMLGQAIWH